MQRRSFFSMLGAVPFLTLPKDIEDIEKIKEEAITEYLEDVFKKHRENIEEARRKQEKEDKEIMEYWKMCKEGSMQRRISAKKDQ